MKKVKIELTDKMSVVEISNKIEQGLRELKSVAFSVNDEIDTHSGRCLLDRHRIISKSTIVITDINY